MVQTDTNYNRFDDDYRLQSFIN